MQSVSLRGLWHSDLVRTPSSNCCSRKPRCNPPAFQSERSPAVGKSRVQQCSTVWCTALSQQSVHSIVSPVHELSPAQALPHSTSMLVRSAPCAQHQQKRFPVLATNATNVVAAQLTNESSSASIHTNPQPVGPQRAANQRSIGSAATVSAAATAAVTAPFATHEQQEQYSEEHQHSMTRQEGSTWSAAHVWLPDKQLWVPHPAAAVASPTNLHTQSSSSGQGLARVFMASAATAGRKRHMEDRHVVAALHPERGVTSAQGAVMPQQAVSLAAVFDGHAGDATASYAAQHIPRLLHNALSGQAKGGSKDGPAVLSRGLLTPDSALAASFHWFDRWWSDARCDTKFTQHGWDESGSTAVISMVSGRQLVVANAGDSIALMARGSTSRRLTEEHRLDNEAEVARVREAGGQVVRNHQGGAPRVVGTSSQTRYKGIMVTRSLGDFAFKSPQALLSAEPYVASHQLEPTDRLVLLTSDGVTDVVPDDDMLDIGLRAIEQARSRTNNGNALAKAAAKAVMDAALDKGSKDNITVVAMLLDWGSEFDDEAQ